MEDKPNQITERLTPPVQSVGLNLHHLQRQKRILELGSKDFLKAVQSGQSPIKKRRNRRALTI